MKAENNKDFKETSISKKVIFLDIDGVLQPSNYENRFDHIDEIEELNAELLKRFNVDYSKYNKYDIMAVYYDWHPEALDRIKRIVKECNADIVISSNWRDDKYGLERMRDFFKIYGLDEYIIDKTINDRYHTEEEDMEEYERFRKWADEITKQYEENVVLDENYKPHTLFGRTIAPYLPTRTCEILYYLKTHPDIVTFVAIDDLNLTSVIENNFVRTKYYLTEEEYERCIEILSKSEYTLKYVDFQRD